MDQAKPWRRMSHVRRIASGQTILQFRQEVANKRREVAIRQLGQLLNAPEQLIEAAIKNSHTIEEFRRAIAAKRREVDDLDRAAAIKQRMDRLMPSPRKMPE
jgi:hypothetical protein